MFSARTFWVGILLSLSALAIAQSGLDSVQHLNEVTISADRYREVIPSQRLAGEQLEALSSFSVADAIRYFSGVQIKDYGGIGGLKTVDVRSMGSNHLGVFYDGIQLGNAQNGQVDLGKFSLDNVEEISLYNGQKSEILQSAKDFGSAGTIYLRTRRPQFADGKTTNVKAIFRTGSFDLANPSVLWEQKIGGKDAINRVSTSLNAEYIYSSGKYKYRYTQYNNNGSLANQWTGIRQNGDIHSLRLEGGLNGFLEQGKWHAKTYYYDSERGIPGAIVSNVPQHPERQWDRNFFVQGSFQKQVFKNDEVLFNLKYSNDYMRYLNLDTLPSWDEDGRPIYKTSYANNRFTQQEIYASFANKYAIFPNWDASLSVDYQRNMLNTHILNEYIDAVRNTVLAAVATAFEWQRIKAQASVLGTFVLDDVDKKQDSAHIFIYKPHTHLSKRMYTPAVFFSYKPFGHHDFNLRAFYKSIFRMPTFNDLYYTEVGNIKLNPEYATQYNVGFEYTLAVKTKNVSPLQLHIHADAYYNEITDKIVSIPKGSGQYRWTMMNIGYVEIRGIDVFVGTKNFSPFHKALQINFTLNYTYQKVQDFTPPQTANQATFFGGQIAYTPWHSGSAIMSAVWRSWNANYSFIYVGERYENSANIRGNHVQPWYTHDLTVGKTFRLRRGALHPPTMKISAEVNNILNQYYDVIKNYPMPGRNFKVILKMDI